MEWYQYVISIAGGFLAGVINTLTGNGSAVTLTILMGVLGLPPDMANGTNRIGIFAGGITSCVNFYRKGKLNIKSTIPYLVPMFLGAVCGIEVSLMISPEAFKKVMGILLVLLLFVLLAKPERWTRETAEGAGLPIYVLIPLFFALGFYGGFIQMGMGVFMLAIMVLGAKFSISESNSIKVFGVTVFTFYAILRFAWSAKINWWYGAVLAVGQSAGGWVGAWFAVEHPRAAIWTYRLLIVVIIIGILQVFGFI